MILPYNWKEYLRISNIRDALNRNQAIISIIAVVFTILAIWWILKSEFKSPYKTNVNQYFYDTSTQSLVVKPSTAIPPLIGKSGKRTVVRAYLFTCSSCSNKQIGYLQEYTPAARQALVTLQKMGNAGPNAGPGNPSGPSAANNPFQLEMTAFQGSLVRLPAKGSPWMLANTPQGMQIMTPPPCAKGVLKPCIPQ